MHFNFYIDWLVKFQMSQQLLKVFGYISSFQHIERLFLLKIMLIVLNICLLCGLITIRQSQTIPQEPQLQQNFLILPFHLSAQNIR
jgi:hypothetical protein